MVLGKYQECQTAKDCNPASCKGIMICGKGICVCDEGTRRKPSCGPVNDRKINVLLNV